MGWQPGQGDEPGTEPGPDPRDSSDSSYALSPVPARDAHLCGFAKDGEWDACPPSAALAAALEAASGPEWRCLGATRDEMLGVLRQWQALEAWAAAGKLGALRALIRDDDQPLPGGGYHDDLPEGWTKSLTHVVALTLSMPAVSAEKLMWTAWDLQARLPGTGALLAAGDLTYAKAKAVYEALQLLSNEDAARAEAMIVPELPDKTYGQVQKLAVQAAVTVDPQSATRRREDAERNKCRVHMFREESGAAALSGRDLPTDQTLAAHANVCARAQEYKDSGAFPDDTRMDQYRVAAYLDLLNGGTAEARIATGQIVTATRTTEVADEPGQSSDDEKPDGCGPNNSGPNNSGPDDNGPNNSGPNNDGPDNSGPDEPGPNNSGPNDGGPNNDDGPNNSGPDDSAPDEDGRSDKGSSAGRETPSLPRLISPSRLTDLVLPLATLLGLAERPGEGHGLGPLDPDLCQELAIAAAASPWTQLCVTVTNADGIAIGHGCARLPRRRTHRNQSGNSTGGNHGCPGTGLTLALPARANLTITTSLLAKLAGKTRVTGASPPELCAAESPWSFTPTGGPGPPGGFGAWTLTLPDGRNLTVNLESVPTFTCDHSHESHAYKPNDTLRHLVQVRDYECTFPPCSRHARESDFEHGVPHHKGGRTCACNAGARSRACHQVKQSPGWNVSQPRPGWHQWITPTGRTYTQGPKRYPV